MLLMLPLFLRLQSEVGKGDKGDKRCGGGGKVIVAGGDRGNDDGRGDREIMVGDRAMKRSSISIECDSSDCSSIVKIGSVVVVITGLIVSFGDSVLMGFVMALS